MDNNELKKRISEDPDFIRCPKCENSLKKFLDRNPDGVEDQVIAKLLMIEETEVESIYQSAVEKLRQKLVDFE